MAPSLPLHRSRSSSLCARDARAGACLRPLTFTPRWASPASRAPTLASALTPDLPSVCLLPLSLLVLQILRTIREAVQAYAACHTVNSTLGRLAMLDAPLADAFASIVAAGESAGRGATLQRLHKLMDDTAHHAQLVSDRPTPDPGLTLDWPSRCPGD